MIDTRRTRQMTRMALYEQRETEDYRLVARHDKKSYVRLWTFVCAVLSIIVSLFYIVGMLCLIFALHPEGISTIVWILFGVISVIALICHVYLYVKYGKIRDDKRYDRCKQKNDYMEDQYKILDEMYQ